MKTPPTLFAVLAAVSLAAQAGTARASPMSFCGDDGICNNGGVYNGASVTVTKVKVKQLAGPNNCPVVEKTHSANLIGNPEADIVRGALLVKALTKEEFGFRLSLRKDCPYEVRFSTTSGCVGDKVLKISMGNQNADPPKTLALLEGGCGTLKAGPAWY